MMGGGGWGATHDVGVTGGVPGLKLITLGVTGGVSRVEAHNARGDRGYPGLKLITLGGGPT